MQCVGSRDRQIGNEYCSKVCCGIASKQAIELRQQIPDSKVFIFYIDMRMYGYWENEIYWPAQEKYHVNYVKGVISEVLPKGNQLLVRGEDTTMSRPMEVTMDMIRRKASSLRVQRRVLLTSMTPFQRQVLLPHARLLLSVKRW